MEAILQQKEREDKLNSAKRKLKSYRARQASKTANVPGSPSSSSKRGSLVVVSSANGSPARKGGHAHRRSSSRAGSISVIMPSSSNGHTKRASIIMAAAAAQASPSASNAGIAHNRRNSRRHSRNISISIAATVTAATATAECSTTSASASSSTRSPFPYSASSPSLATAASTTAQTPSSPFARRQSVPVQPHHYSTYSSLHASTSSSSAAPAGRILSPSTSPILQQGQQQPSPFMARRSSLQMPKSPSFFEAQQLAALPPLPAPNTHARRPSKHTRRTSVATRRESMEIMSGVSMVPAFPTSPDPSATGQFLASSDLLSRSNTVTSEASVAAAVGHAVGPNALSAALASFSWPAAAEASSSAMDERSISETSEEEQERKNALSALEGRLRAPSEAIELPSLDALPKLSPNSLVGTASSSRESKRASWNGNTIANVGGKGAIDLGMLVEEEEEDEEEEGNDSLSPLPTAAASAPAAQRSTSPLTGTKRQRPSSLVFPPARSLPFGGSSFKSESPLSPSEAPAASSSSSYISPRATSSSARSAPRPLSLSTASVASPTASDGSLKSARRLSGLRSLTLTSPEHVLQRQHQQGGEVASPSSTASSAVRSSFAKRHSVAVGNTSASDRSASFSQSQSGGRRVSATSIGSSALSSSVGPSGSTPAKTFNRSSASFANSSFASGASGRRFSDFSASGSGAPASGPGFGELVMEDMSIAEVDGEDLADEEEQNKSSSDLLNVERPALSRSTSSNASNTSGVASDDPVILGMQMQALRSQVEHLRSENTTLSASLASAEQARSVEVSALREELAEVREASAGIEEERESLREDVDGWRERCTGLERALREERERAEDERREGLLLREKVRKLSSRLEQQQTTSASPDQSEDQQLAAAQAKLIAEMRDQIFSLAAALERERLAKASSATNAGAGSPVVSRNASPLLRALESQDANIAALNVNAPAEDKTVKLSGGRHHNESATSSTASSYNFSSFSGSTFSGNVTEDTSVSADEYESVFGGKSPSSPAFNPNYASYASSSVAQPLGGGGISIHGTSLPLGRVDSAAGGGFGLQTLAEEDEEATEEEESLNDDFAEDAWTEEAARSTTEEGEEEEVLNDAVPELVPDELRPRTQSGSVSTDASEGMPLTPAKEQAPASGPAKNAHQRSHSFIRQWAFPSGAISHPSDEDDTGGPESFWNLRLSEAPLPALPVKEDYLAGTPFSAEISFDEDLFSNAFAKHNRPPSLLLSQGPPPARSSGASRLGSDLASPDTPSTAATPSTAGSRLSLQGLSSFWGWKSAPAPVSAPLPVAEPARPVSSVPSKLSGGRRLLKLEPSPLSRLDFTTTCGGCDHSGSRIIRL